MSVFPGDMNIGWGFGLERQEEFFPLESQEPQLTDPLLAVSELEQRVNDLEERLRSLTIVVNSVVEAVQANEPAYIQSEKD